MYFFFHDLTLSNYYYLLLVVVVVGVFLLVLLFFFCYFFFIIRFSGVAVDRVPVMLVKYPHCTPITPSRRTQLWKHAAPGPD